MKVSIEGGAFKEVTNISFVHGAAAVASAAFGNNEELIITLPGVGATGPAGATGVTGATGAQGDTGAP